LDDGDLRQQIQSLTHEYELLLRNNPNFAAGYAAYGYLLSKTSMQKEATAMLLKANQLDPDIPLVKNQLGNLLAEDGKPLQAAPYYIAAIKLEPNEPLYHYQLGTLLAEAREEFLKANTPEWTRASIDAAMHQAFKRAAELAPDRFEFAYRYAESFYDLEKPDWDAALKAWSALEEKAPTPIERQTMRLHAANILLKIGKRDHARALLATIDEPKLQAQKQKLVAQLPGTPKN
jgi:tetratricopeptide (TPR) repeat protein